MKTKKTKKSKIQNLDEITKELFQNNSTLKFIADFKETSKKYKWDTYTKFKVIQNLLSLKPPVRKRKLKDPDLITKIAFNFMLFLMETKFKTSKNFYKNYFVPDLIQFYPELINDDLEVFSQKLYDIKRNNKSKKVNELKNHPYFNIDIYNNIQKSIYWYEVMNKYSEERDLMFKDMRRGNFI